jgi:hypothetical protein
MKRTRILFSALVISTTLLTAQNEKKTTTVRIKKVENINGVEKITDTTYTSDDPSNIKLGEGDVNIQEWQDKEGKVKKVVIINDNTEVPEIHVDGKTNDGMKTILFSSNADTSGKAVMKKMIVNTLDGKQNKSTVINVGRKMTPDEEKAWNDKIINDYVLNTDGAIMKGPDNKEEQTIIIKKVSSGASKDEVDRTPVFVTCIINKKVNITDASEADMKLIGKPAGVSDNKLAIDNINFYPNPNNGKFKLNFNLKSKGSTEVNIVNIEGKSIYRDELPDFSGDYNKEIDISASPKGVYFVKIKQGDHAQLKKLVLE